MKGEDDMTRKVLVIRAKEGLRGRNAELFTGVATKFSCSIDIVGAGRDKIINAKSIMGVLSLMAKEGDSIALAAKGADAPEAIQALTQLVENDFKLENK